MVLVLLEYGTWSHVVMSSLGARARGGCRALAFCVKHCQTPSEVRIRWVIRVRWGLNWFRMGPCIKGTLIRESRVIRQGPLASGNNRFTLEPCCGTTGPDGSRRIARLPRIGAQLILGPIREPTVSARDLRGL